MKNLVGKFELKLVPFYTISASIEMIIVFNKFHFFRFGIQKQNNKNNRFVVAARDINAGELLLSEMPVVCGPYWDIKASCCLNCYAPSDTMCK